MNRWSGKAQPFPVSTFSAREAGGRVWPRVERFLRNPWNIAKTESPRSGRQQRTAARLPFARFAGSCSPTVYPGLRKTRSALGHTPSPALRADQETPPPWTNEPSGTKGRQSRSLPVGSTTSRHIHAKTGLENVETPGPKQASAGKKRQQAAALQRDSITDRHLRDKCG